jgi:hypothetical protein
LDGCIRPGGDVSAVLEPGIEGFHQPCPQTSMQGYYSSAAQKPWRFLRFALPGALVRDRKVSAYVGALGFVAYLDFDDLDQFFNSAG